ncbi:MAG TPA: BsuBI/PstI family type II restriction endonuclease [Stellaceae bacterium]|nr:BsuBI/PstI family type II restriction endonuclease [Stellaceae bacterium]
MNFPALLDRNAIQKRLRVIFPEGTPERNKCVRGAAAATVFTMLYVGAVERGGRWLGPVHVVRMSDRRASKVDDGSRAAYARRAVLIGRRWYAENSREQVRDEVLRQGLIPNNAVVERPGIATTSGAPRYALKHEFAALFDPSLDDVSFEKAADAWRASSLSAAARARISIMRRGAVASDQGVLVRFPSGETRRLTAGPSSVISRAVIEEFAPRFLVEPAVLWLSESGAKVISRDDGLAADLGLKIDPSKNLPDIILVDRGTESSDFLLVFVEVVATDGPVTPQRAEALASMAKAAGYGDRQIAFVTAYLDRTRPEFRRTFPSLAWQAFAWFASEPEHVVILHDGVRSPKPLGQLLIR